MERTSEPIANRRTGRFVTTSQTAMFPATSPHGELPARRIEGQGPDDPRVRYILPRTSPVSPSLMLTSR